MQIYADNAATTKLGEKAKEIMNGYFDADYGNPSSAHSFGRKAALSLKKARKDIADRIGASSDEIFFTSSGTESDNQAILSAAAAGEEKGKKHIVSSSYEHHAVLSVLEYLKKTGFEITLLPVGENGIVSAESVKKALRGDTCLVSVMYANNETGSINPISDIGKICATQNIPFHTDAVAAGGYLPIDVKKENIGMLSLSAHKFHGPKGVGILYRRKNIPLTALIRGGGQERGMRAGTENVPAVMGAAAAFCEICGKIDDNTRKLLKMRDFITEGLEKIPHSALNGDRKNRLPGNVNFSFEGVEGESLLLLLDTKGICASSGSACTSRSSEPSHVLIASGREKELADGSLRISLSSCNTMEEAEYIVKTVTETVSYLRENSQSYKDKLSGRRRFLLP